MTLLAVIADPHYHDCGWVPKHSGLPGAIRTYAETIASTRVFNESAAAFRAALDRAVAEGARHVLLIGDLTDDGQVPNIAGAVALLAHYRKRHGLRVFATPGNHDFFAVAGRPQVKTFIATDGSPVVVDSSTTPEAATLGALPALQMMGRLGYQPETGDLHWESPFGRNPDWAARSYDVTSPDGGTCCRMIDASYLVEPVPDLWLLSIDANVCAPRNGATDLRDAAQFHDPTDTGWSGVLHHRAHVLSWMADVAQRAQVMGKRLIAFSHYPALDALGGASADEVALFGASGLARRAPGAEVAAAFAKTGVQVHFSGHLHVNDTAAYRGPEGAFLNLAVPSPVGFPAGMKLADVGVDQITIRTVSLADAPAHDVAFTAYRAEAICAGQSAPPASHAHDYGAFLNCHLAAVVQDRYIPREWPEDMADFVASRHVDDLLALIGVAGLDAPDIALAALVEDWYRLRKGGEAAAPFIAADRLAFYHKLCAQLPDGNGSDLAVRFITLLRIMRAYLARLPNGDFIIHLPDLRITPI
ncbi:metallophosphoesterase [Cypionkella sp.]|uniref:metallophosphoesterase family protein n=1 Tax=Cypionkella sp. TaxID=2811411 RepID=UPI002ABC76BD|nr:metallophosphoesterase [Cypionkella sp.]MDZ4393092.1 metallophosphoesterase [Cypionkella sp.]